MKWGFIGAVAGLVIGLVLTLMLLNFYVSINPQATDIDKGLVLLFGLFLTGGLIYGGFLIGGDP